MRKYLMLCILIISILHETKAQHAEAIEGKWLTKGGAAQVEIYQERGKYHGKIVWVKEPSESSKINTLILVDFVYDELNKEWNDGTVYDPRHGHKASGYLQLKDSETLRVVGYKGFRWLSDTETWARLKHN